MKATLDPTNFPLRHVVGVDFSGASMAGRNAWWAKLAVVGRPQEGPPLELLDLQPLGKAAGDPERSIVCEFLADQILASEGTLWGMDFPFGLPIELGLGDWPDQLEHVASHDGDAKSYGRSLVDLAQQRSGSLHIRRETDIETKTPFDCYHYRIIYQTFHGMRDVLRPIAGDPNTAVLPFQSDRMNLFQRIRRIVVESCPSSTLKRLDLPHQRYKQSGDKPIEPHHRQTRQAIWRELSQLVRASEHRRRVTMTNPGGDALDAVLAGAGAWLAWHRENHTAIANHPRYRLEGRVYC